MAKGKNLNPADAYRECSFFRIFSINKMARRKGSPEERAQEGE
jgi:hypothetical protein